MPSNGDIIQFKRGSTTAFNALKAQNDASQNGVLNSGTFYFVEDTNRLYLAKTQKDLVDLNQYIHFVDTRILSGDSDTRTALPSTANDGDVYYIVDENILCTWNASKSGNPQHWVQINPDTVLANSTNKPQNPSTFTVTGLANNAGATLSQWIRDTKGNAFNSEVSIVPGNNNITISYDTAVNAIKIFAADQSDNTRYTIGADTDSSGSQGVLRLHGTDNVDTTVNFTATDDITITSGVDSNSANFVRIGGARNVNTMTQTFNADGAGSIETTLFDRRSTTIVSASLTPVFQYGEFNSATAVFSSSGIAALDVYTKQEVQNKIDAALGAANALTYKSTVGASDYTTKLDVNPANNDAGTSTVVSGKHKGQVGDTYIVSTSFTLNGETYDPGDLVIATGTDDAVDWQRVPAGDDQILTFTNQATSTPGIIITDSIQNNTTVGGIKFVPDSRTGTSAIGYSASTNVDGQLEIEMRHGDAGTGTAITATTAVTQNYTTTATVVTPVITGISVDSHGHITTATMATLTVADTHATLGKVLQGVTAVGATNRRAEYTGQLKLDNGVAGSTIMELSLMSDNLTITPVADNSADAMQSQDDTTKKVPTMKINLEWGSF